jgi:hypothetical protein
LKHKLNYGFILIGIVIVTVIGISAFFVVIGSKPVHIDTSTPSVEKNITVTDKTKSTLSSLGYILDETDQKYFAPENTVLYMKTGKNYTITVATLVNGSGYWIESYAPLVTNETKSV